MFYTDYYFEGQVRWDLGLGNPNVAGCLLLGILVFFVGGHDQMSRNSGGVKVGLLLVEFSLVVFLLKTYSRGSLLALFASSFLLFALKVRKGCSAKEYVVWGYRVAVVLVVSAFVGMGERVSSVVALADPSSANRLEYWWTFLGMVRIFPLFGFGEWRSPFAWGVGECGDYYLNWFQPVDDSFMVVGPVNSYLHIAQEYGLPALGVALIPLAFAFDYLRYQFLNRSESRIGFAAALSLSIISMYIACFFSTLWNHPLVLLLLLLSTVVLVVCERRYLLGKTSVLRAIALTASACLILFCVSCFVEDDGVDVRFSDGFVSLVAVDAPDCVRVVGIVSDPYLFGGNVGRLLRGYCIDRGDVRFEVAQKAEGLGRFSGGLTILVGSAASEMEDEALDDVDLVVIYPRCPALAKSRRMRLVVLPRQNSECQYGDWIEWARFNDVEVLYCDVESFTRDDICKLLDRVLLHG